MVTLNETVDASRQHFYISQKASPPSQPSQRPPRPPAPLAKLTTTLPKMPANDTPHPLQVCLNGVTVTTLPPYRLVGEASLLEYLQSPGGATHGLARSTVRARTHSVSSLTRRAAHTHPLPSLARCTAQRGSPDRR
jgi:hypothetical protein